MKLSVCHLLLPPLLLLFCCHCLAAIQRKVNVGYHHSIYKTTPSIMTMKSETQINEERSGDHSLTTNFSRADFPCPESADIAPCTCAVEFNNNRIYLDCTLAESVDQLVEVFQQDFPVKELYRFTMANNNAIKGFPSFMNGITFESVYLAPGPFILADISEHFFFDLKDTLVEFVIYENDLTTDFFPFFILPSLNQLVSLSIYFSDISWIPQIRAPKLTLFALESSTLELLVSGTFPIGPGPMNIDLNANQIHTIEAGSIFFADQTSADSNERIKIDLWSNQLKSLVAGTFPLRNGPMHIDLYPNQISTIEPGTFVLPASTDLLSLVIELGGNELETVDEAAFGTLMPFITYLGLSENPLICGCDMAWLILNEDFLATVDNYTTCADGTNLHAIDHQQYIEFC